MQTPARQPHLDLSELHRWLHRTLRQHKLGTFTHPLLRDAVTVALGAKPAAMLDFYLPPPVLEQVFQRMHTTNQPFLSSLALVTLTSSSTDSAVYLLHRPSFTSAKRLHCAPAPLVDISPALSAPRLLTVDAAASVLEELQRFASSLSAALEAADPSTSHATLRSPPDLCAPTLCGWLLSYPVLYTFPAALEVPSTNCLSSQPLALFTTRLHPTPRLVQQCASFASDTGSVALQSFSVPSSLLSEPDVATAMRAWEKRVSETFNGDNVRQWVQQLVTDRTEVCLPHVSL